MSTYKKWPIFKHNIFLNLISGAGGPAGVGTVGQDVEGYRSQQYSFDSTALERAAKAAKDLEKSAHATEALALSRVQEETKQKEQEVNIKQYEAQIENMKIEQKRVEGLWITVHNSYFSAKVPTNYKVFMIINI